MVKDGHLIKNGGLYQNLFGVCVVIKRLAVKMKKVNILVYKDSEFFKYK